ncbi:unnamed protein product [Discosporangium mesarthrocarpum]
MEFTLAVHSCSSLFGLRCLQSFAFFEGSKMKRFKVTGGCHKSRYSRPGPRTRGVLCHVSWARGSWGDGLLESVVFPSFLFFFWICASLFSFVELEGLSAVYHSS